jgi:hypothetical protein
VLDRNILKKFPEFLILMYLTSGGHEEHHCSFIVYFSENLYDKCYFLQGKTLAFVLPILESLVNGANKASRRTEHGRTPSVLVLLPTRELANQVKSCICT